MIPQKFVRAVKWAFVLSLVVTVTAVAHRFTPEEPALEQSLANAPGGNGKIVFQSIQRNGNSDEIFVMDPDGSNQTNLTNNLFRLDQNPNWSPDGEDRL